MGYEIHELEPAFIGMSRELSTDDLTKRGFGEAIYANSTPAQRAAKLTQKDLADMDARIVRREEWMCARTMLDNGCTMQEMIDNQTKGDTKVVKFYNPGHENDHIYVPAAKWNEEGGKFFEDVAAMCDMLSSRGLASADLLLGADTYNAVLDLEKVQRLLDKNSGIIVGQIEEQLSPYHGVVYGGTLNFKGHKLNLISVDETYVDDEGKVRPQFPKTDALVTGSGCGHLMYGAITQINYGVTKHTTIASRRVPKFSLNQENDLRKTILQGPPAGCTPQLLPVDPRQERGRLSLARKEVYRCLLRFFAAAMAALHQDRAFTPSCVVNSARSAKAKHSALSGWAWQNPRTSPTEARRAPLRRLRRLRKVTTPPQPKPSRAALGRPTLTPTSCRT